MIGAGTVCIFHVGGFVETNADRGGGVPRWEFFIGDRPHVPELDSEGKRQPLTQIAEVDVHANPGDVILSWEVVALIGEKCSLEILEDKSARLISIMDATKVLLWTLIQPFLSCCHVLELIWFWAWLFEWLISVGVSNFTNL